MSNEPAASIKPESITQNTRNALTLESIAEQIHQEVWAPVYRYKNQWCVAWLLLGLLCASYLARLGTLKTRSMAWSLVGVVVVFVIVSLVWWRSHTKSASKLIRYAARALGNDQVARVLTAHELAERITHSTNNEGVSLQLAQLHVQRTLALLHLDQLSAFAQRQKFAIKTFIWLSVVITIAAFVHSPMHIYEGVNIAFARRGQAPLKVVWLDDVRIEIQPPAYTHKPTRNEDGYHSLAVEQGSLLTIQGLAKQKGRTLTLFNGVEEIPLLDQGNGKVAARWTVMSSCELRVRARFGHVFIDDPNRWPIQTIADLPPDIIVDGAPKTIELAQQTNPTIALRYEAHDDYGLREVHLVLQMGTREERKVLSKFDNEPQYDQGGYTLRLNDPFLKNALTPIRVRIEARDNDPIVGSKWGKSQELILNPPTLGENERLRIQALRTQRNAWTDWLASLLEQKPNASITALKKEAIQLKAQLQDTLAKNYNRMPIPMRMKLGMQAAAQALERQLNQEERSPASRTLLIKNTGTLLLRIDDSIHALGTRDTQRLAKTFSELANESADILKDESRKLTNIEINERLRLNLKVLNQGGQLMRELGWLGSDLGEIVLNDLRREARARESKPNADWFHAELAMRDLAARLRDPVPSFGSSNGSQKGSNGMGDSSSGQSDGDEETETEREAGQVQDQLEQLAKEHNSVLREVEDEIRAAEDPKSLDHLTQEAKKRAQELRDVVRHLPREVNAQPSLESIQAIVRLNTEAMANALEALRLGETKEHAKSALQHANDLLRLSWLRSQATQPAKPIVEQIEKQAQWVDDLIRKLRQNAIQKIENQSSKFASRERSAELRTREFSESKENSSRIPEEIQNLLKQAAQEMDRASQKIENKSIEEGQEAQKLAQRLLEQARDQAREETDSSSQGGDSAKNGSISSPSTIEIPKADAHKGPEDFRTRVLKGLSSGTQSPRIKEAVKRYTDRLLR